MSQEVLFEVADGIAVLTINRPEVRNAIDAAVTRGISDAMQTVEQSGEIAVAIITGAGDRAFSAGADLTTIAAGRVADLRTDAGGFAGFVRLPRTTPVIAAVNGFALAGGCEIVLACDMVIAVEESQFGLPEVRRGLVAAAGGLFRLPRAIPRAKAAELILTGTTIDAVEAHRLGLVNHVVKKSELLGTARNLAGRIAQNAPLAVRQSLGVLQRSAGLGDESCWQISDEASARVMNSKDVVEGAVAFTEKRAPAWTESWSGK